MAWDVSSITNDLKNIQPSQSTSNTTSFALKDDGTKLYVLTAFGERVDQYSLSTPYDISTAVYDSKFFTVGLTGDDVAQGQAWFSTDGTRLFLLVLDSINGDTSVFSYLLSVAWDISTASFEATKAVATPAEASGRAANMSNDGLQLYVVYGGSSGGENKIQQFDLSVAWDITTASVTAKSFVVTVSDIIRHIAIENTGQTLLVNARDPATGGGNVKIFQFTLSTPYDISTAVYDNLSFNLTASQAEILGVDAFYVEPCSTKIYFSGDTNGIKIFQFDMGATACNLFLQNASSFTVKASGDSGVVRKLVSSVSGLSHLNIGQDVCNPVTALVDGSPAQLEVCNGVLSLPRLAGRVHIGLPYRTDIETLNIENPGNGTWQGKLSKIAKVVMRFYKSRLPLVGPTFFRMNQMKQREFEEYGEPTQMLTGDAGVVLPPDWNSNGRIAIRQKDPLPLTILGIIPEVDVEDD